MFRVEWSNRAKNQLEKLTRRNPEIARDIFEKVEWLARNAETVAHERLVGRLESSLHSGQYRIPYMVDRTNQTIFVEDVDKHDAAYRKLKRR